MKPKPPIRTVFAPSTRADQFSRILQRDLSLNALPSPLPGERQLAAMYHVGRASVREAIRQLVEEGVLSRKENKRIFYRQRSSASTGSSPRLACLLTRFSFHQMNFHELCWIDLLRERLAVAGLLLRILHRPDLYLKDSHWHVQQVIREYPSAVWLLHRSSASLQRSVERMGVPALICGSPHSGVDLPSCDTDQVATGSFVANLFARRGYTHVHLIDSPGYTAGRLQFLRGLEEGNATNRLALSSDDQGSLTPTSSMRLTRRITQHKGKIGLLVRSASLSLEIMTALLAKGVRFPEDAGLLCLDGSPYLEATTPKTAHFHYPSDRYAAMVCRHVLRETKAHGARCKSERILPEFVDGGTLARA